MQENSCFQEGLVMLNLFQHLIIKKLEITIPGTQDGMKYYRAFLQALNKKQ